MLLNTSGQDSTLPSCDGHSPACIVRILWVHDGLASYPYTRWWMYIHGRHQISAYICQCRPHQNASSHVQMMLYISPPFGNYLPYKNAVRIRGTFTWKRRKGLLYHTARSLRPVKGGWRNQIGFRKKGIKKGNFNTKDIFSIGWL